MSATSRAVSHPGESPDGDEAFIRGYQVGYQRGSFTDGEQIGFEDGFHERRIREAIRHHDEIQDMIRDHKDTDQDDSDEDTETRRRDIMDDIERLTQPNEKLTKGNLKQLVDAYRNCKGGASDNDSREDDKDTDTDKNTDTDRDTDTDQDTDTDEDTDKDRDTDTW